MSSQDWTGRPHGIDDQSVDTSTGDPHAQDFAAFRMWCLISSPNEGRLYSGSRAPCFSDNDNSIELLTLGLMKVHHLEPGRSLDTIQNLLLCKGLI